MINKRTLTDYALWAALPMAQSSKIEGRLTRILDRTRRRTLPRRALLLGAVVGTAALVPLAMLRPVAEAQAAPATANTVRLLGVQDIDIHHTDHRWWNAAGQVLAGGVGVGAPSRTAMDLFRSANDHNLRFAVGLPNFIEGDSVTFVPLGSFFPKEVMSPGKKPGDAWSMYAAFSGSQKTTPLSVGVAAGPWTETVDCPKAAGKLRRSRPSGDVLFTLISPHGLTAVEDVYGSRGLTPPKSASGRAVLIVDDHFHSPSPLPIDRMAVMISSYASRSRSGEAVQRIRHDAENYQRSVYGLNKSGQIVAQLTGTAALSLEDEDNDRFEMEQVISVPRPLLKHIASFRLVARPYQWTQFKNVALQPAQ